MSKLKIYLYISAALTGWALSEAVLSVINLNKITNKAVINTINNAIEHAKKDVSTK